MVKIKKSIAIPLKVKKKFLENTTCHIMIKINKEKNTNLKLFYNYILHLKTVSRYSNSMAGATERSVGSLISIGFPR